MSPVLFTQGSALCYKAVQHISWESLIWVSKQATVRIFFLIILFKIAITVIIHLLLLLLLIIIIITLIITTSTDLVLNDVSLMQSAFIKTHVTEAICVSLALTKSQYCGALFLTLNKQSSCRWFETPWCPCDVYLENRSNDNSATFWRWPSPCAWTIHRCLISMFVNLSQWPRNESVQ